MVEPESQADPKFQTPLAFTRITAKAVHEQLKANAAGESRHVPAERTVHDILNRLGYRLRPVRKTKPQKKFAKPMPSSTICMTSPHPSCAGTRETLRISLDTKAKVKIGAFSRGGVARGLGACPCG